MEGSRSLIIWLLVIGFIGAVYSQEQEESLESLEEPKSNGNFENSSDEKGVDHNDLTGVRIKRHHDLEGINKQGKNGRIVQAVDDVRRAENARRLREEQERRDREQRRVQQIQRETEAERQRLRNRAGGRDAW